MHDIIIEGEALSATLLVIPMFAFDVILGMDWLSTYKAILDCQRRRVTLFPREGSKIVYHLDREIVSEMSVIRHVRGVRQLAKCYVMLCALDAKKPTPDSSEPTPIVDEFPDVFPEDLPGLPPVREVEFGIDLLSGTMPISSVPYRMAPAEMKELRVQLDDLLSKGFIRASTLPWGSPVLFVKKADGSLRLCVNY